MRGARWFVLLGLLLPLALGAEEAGKRADIQQLLALTGAQELGVRVALQVIERFRRVHEDVPPWVWQEILQETQARANDFLAEAIVPIYDRYLTHAEVKGLIAFYQSPLGQKLRSVLPLMNQESRIAGQGLGAAVCRGSAQEAGRARVQVVEAWLRRLVTAYPFPDPATADAEGLVALGGDLRPGRLLAAYAQGLFPWPWGEGWPLAWYSPEPRLVLRPAALHVSRRLRRVLRQGRFAVRWDSAFAQVVDACATVPRRGQRGTWITRELAAAYGRLHALGFAHSVEAWAGDTLVGGLYGVSLGAAFFGESMFSRQPDASKVALVHLVERLRAWGFHFIDCQVYTPHLVRFGAEAWPRRRFLEALAQALEVPTRRGPWGKEGPE
ncbi:MAG: hypothetical protein KatS3mg131_2250 [Candidatus Tectimicrobiota bacterium]|nr:MAG: hypothetical protein KatS3mg131_2250 [Candidatus Tectomicrobia bacterium]